MNVKDEQGAMKVTCVSHVQTDLLVSCSSHSRAFCPGRGDLENAQTTVTVDGPNIASHLLLLPSTTMQYNTIPARVYLGFTIRGQARAEVRLMRSSGRRHVGLTSAGFWAGTVQCAAVRQMKPNHESCDVEITQYNMVNIT